MKSLLRVPLSTGFLVEVVEPGSPAEQVKLQGGDLEMTIAGTDFLLGGDIITAMNSQQFDQSENVATALQGLKVGDEVSLKLFREGNTLEVKYKLSERPLLPGDMPGQSVAEPVSSRQVRRNTSFHF